MDQQKKDGCVLFRTVLEAAEELNEKDALELLTTYAHYALGDTVDLDKSSQIVRITIKQLVPALEAAERRYLAARENGMKGKEAGKEKGGGPGRPKKGETPEEYQKRVEDWRVQKTPSKTPQKPPVNTNQKPPENPLEVEEEVDIEVEVDKEIDKELEIDNNIIDKYKNLTWEQYLKLFIDKHKDFNYGLDFSVFTLTYKKPLEQYQRFLLEKTGNEYPIEYLTFQLTYYGTFGRVFEYNEETKSA